MKGKLQIALGIVVMGACMARAEAGDDWIKDMVIVSGQFIQGGEPARRMFENAKSQCEAAKGCDHIDGFLSITFRNPVLLWVKMIASCRFVGHRSCSAA